jgi:hypothetical protein
MPAPDLGHFDSLWDKIPHWLLGYATIRTKGERPSAIFGYTILVRQAGDGHRAKSLLYQNAGDGLAMLYFHDEMALVVISPSEMDGTFP